MILYLFFIAIINMSDQQYKYLIKLDNEIIMCVDEKNIWFKYIEEKSKELKTKLNDGVHDIFEYVSDDKLELWSKSKGTFWNGTKKLKHIFTITPIKYMENDNDIDIDWGTDGYKMNLNDESYSNNTESDSNGEIEYLSPVNNDLTTLYRYITLKINGNNVLNDEEKKFMIEILENIETPDKLMSVYYKHIERLEDIYLSNGGC